MPTENPAGTPDPTGGSQQVATAAAADPSATPPQDPVDSTPAEPEVAAPSSSTPSPPPAADPPGPADAPPEESILSLLSQRGYDASQFTDDAAAMDALLNVVEEHHKAGPMLELAQRYAPHAESLDAYLAEREAVAASQSPPPPSPSSPPVAETPATPPPEELQWSPPEFSDAWLAGLQQTEGGFYRAPADRPELIGRAKQANEYYEWQQRASRDIVTNFPKMVQQVMAPQMQGRQDSVQKQIDDAVAAAITRYEQQQTQQQYIDEIRPQLVQQDDQGNALLNPVNGQVQLTPRGESFLRHAEQARQYGITSQDDIRSFIDGQLLVDEAKGLFASPTGSPAAPAATGNDPTAAATTAGEAATLAAAAGNGQRPSSRKIGRAKQGKFVRNAIRGQQQTNRGGTIPTATDPDDAMQNPRTSLHELMQQASQDAGILPSTG